LLVFDQGQRLGTTGYEVSRNGEGGAGGAYAAAVETKRAADIILTVGGFLQGMRGGEPASRVYRVQGGTPPAAGRSRMSIGGNGEMVVSGDNMLYVTFDDLGRARAFRDINRPGGEIISFEVNPTLAGEIRGAAVPQAQGRAFPNAPQISDPSKTSNSFGLPLPWIERLKSSSRTGTGRIEK
jgi:hypothetical protein